MRFVLTELAGLDEISGLPGCEEATADVVDAVLDEAAKFAAGVLSPLNAVGDRQGARFVDGAVTMPAGFKDAYRRFCADGWTTLGCALEWGGQGLPRLVEAPVSEMWKSANHAFSLCPLLTAGAVEALLLAGSDQLKQTFLPRMVSGEWTGTMNLTEAGAGSDLGAVRTRAQAQADGTYKLFGEKIFITYGEHDLADNIVHLVLARTPSAPAGVKGISLFLVPKFVVDANGRLGPRNDAWCRAIEDKLGIHASPTTVMVYGERGGALAYLVGEENRGLEYMFVMMNTARFGVGMEGVAACERAYQRARDYARLRLQGSAVGAREVTKVAIINHPDVRRMLMGIKARAEAARALAYVVAAAHDRALHHADPATRQRNQAFVDLLIPVVKGWSTEIGCEAASAGIQVHGGMGYIEATGAAQQLRDARISTIYEGTTGIQANDLVWRKLARDGGAGFRAVIAMMRDTEAAMAAASTKDAGPAAALASIGRRFADAVDALRRAGEWIVAREPGEARAVAAGAVPFLMLFGVVAGGWQMARAALAAQARIDAGDSDAFYPDKIVTARFFADHLLTQAEGLASAVTDGATGTLALDDDRF
jgi:alkylation response protein AidB-like acyl-CoA dehydrogenase